MGWERWVTSLADFAVAELSRFPWVTDREVIVLADDATTVLGQAAPKGWDAGRIKLRHGPRIWIRKRVWAGGEARTRGLLCHEAHHIYQTEVGAEVAEFYFVPFSYQSIARIKFSYNGTNMETEPVIVQRYWSSLRSRTYWTRNYPAIFAAYETWLTAQGIPLADEETAVTVAPDFSYPGIKTEWIPAHESNYWKAGEGYGGRTNEPVAIVLHTPEEPWDDNESTPRVFQQPNFGGSTGYYGDSDGDIIQMVRDKDMAWANGVTTSGTKPTVIYPRPVWWKAEYISYNACTLSIEIEGYAATIADTFIPGTPQFESVARWTAEQCKAFGIPIDQAHIVFHSELANDRYDPGAGFPRNAFMARVLSMSVGVQTPPDPVPAPEPDPGANAGPLEGRMDELEAALIAHVATSTVHNHTHATGGPDFND